MSKLRAFLLIGLISLTGVLAGCAGCGCEMPNPCDAPNPCDTGCDAPNPCDTGCDPCG